MRLRFILPKSLTRDAGALNIVVTCHAQCVSMARYCYVLYAFSPRDGGWVRWHGRWPLAADAIAFALRLWPLAADDVLAFMVIRTIRFD